MVVDPVIITKHGDFLLAEAAYKDFINLIVPMADVITPNIYEAQILSGLNINSIDDMKEAAIKIQKLGAKNVVIKGKHDNSQQTDVEDLVLTEQGAFQTFVFPYVDTIRLNGTGDIFSATITAELAKGTDLLNAVRIAKKVVYQAISVPIEVGSKHGPVNLWNVKSK